ncbi:MAG: sporulation protein YqfD [Oscillospiraceae bacterium]|jgi:similar to stage IV sporulation protein
MQSLVNRLQGQVYLEVEGAYPERFLNICAANSLPFWGLTHQSETCLRVKMTRKHYKRLPPFAERAMCTVTPLRQSGLPYFLGRFRRRYAFLVGAGICLLSLFVFSRFIIDIEVIGNESVSADRILTELKEAGFRSGVYGPAIDVSLLAHQVLLEMPELSYCNINISGCRATVIVRERISKPDIVDLRTPANVVATKAGMITRIETLEGTPKVMIGSTVLPGELLISGVDDIESAAKDGSSVGTRMLHAMGNVYAKTYYKRSAQTLLTSSAKAYTGEEKRRFSLLLGGSRINFHTNSRISYDNYDKIEMIHWLALPFDLTFPLGLQIETYTEYALRETDVNQASAEAYLQSALLAGVKEELGDGELLNHSFESEVRDGVLTVTLLCECEEQIGKIVELPVESGAKGTT